MAKVFVFIAEGFEEIEGLTVVDLLRRANIETTMVSITDDVLVTGSHQITIAADTLFDEVDYSDADMLVLPGGMPGTRNLLEHEGLELLLKDYSAKGKELAAICAAPIVLGTMGLLNGKKAICYPGNETSLMGAEIVNAPVVVDGNITTSKGMGTAIDFSLEIIRKLKGAEEAARIAKTIQYDHYTQ